MKPPVLRFAWKIYARFSGKKETIPLLLPFPTLLPQQSKISLEIRRRARKASSELFIHDERKTRGSEFSRVLFYELLSRSRGFLTA